MKAFSLENVKSFTNSGLIEIKPITIFVGPNSSGKSSLMRFPVVLSQTIKEDISTPLLFSGNQIDYGYFQDVVYKHSEKLPISFSLEIEGKDVWDYIELTAEKKRNFNSIKTEICSNLLKINVEILKRNELIVNKFELMLGEKNITEINLIENDLYSVKIQYLPEYYMKCYSKYYPDLPKNNIAKSEVKFESKLTFDKFMPVINLLQSNILVLNTGKIPFIDDGIVKNAIDILIASKEKYSEKEYHKINDSFRISYSFDLLFFLINSIKSYLNNYFNQIVYIGPFRKDPERVYRFNENAISNVGKRGENSIFLLGRAAQKNSNLVDKVSTWFDRTLGCEIKVSSIDTSLFKVLIYNKLDDEGENLLDVGYGISQVLPIVTQLYFDNDVLEDNRRKFISRTYVIEQPELHLHPAAQGSLADLFAEKIINDQTSKIMIETHSEHLIRKFQVLVADPDVPITHNDIAIYYVDKQNNTSTVKQMYLTEQGQFVERWPSGFFDKSYELSKELIRAAAKPRD